MLRFSDANWARFFTHDKQTTIRTKELKLGTHGVYGGSRFKPKRLGSVDVGPCVKKCQVQELLEDDAIHDGFSNLAELLLELGKLNKEITAKTTVYIHYVKVLEKAGEVV